MNDGVTSHQKLCVVRSPKSLWKTGASFSPGKFGQGTLCWIS